MNKLTQLEQDAVAKLKADYASLTDEAKAEVAKAVSWAERHFWPSMAIAFALGVASTFAAVILR